MIKHFYLITCIVCLFAISCEQEKKSGNTSNNLLASWNEGQIKKSILNYIIDSAVLIPVKDRIAVFDLDGTLACETPLWFEMYAAVNGLNQQSTKNPALLNDSAYLYAKKLAANPFDTSVTNHWASPVNYIDSMIWKAYANVDNEVYVNSTRSFLSNTKSQDPRFTTISLADLFYQPMLELIQLLKQNQFSIYVVSGSMQGVLWSVCPQTIDRDRESLIGTTQITNPVYDPKGHHTSFVIQKGIYQPKDDKDGKSENIYSHIGKVPVFAFGNTTGDFGMFRLTSTSKYPHAEYLLNHDDAKREYAYPPYHGKADTTCQKTLTENGWKQVDMSKEFGIIWKKK